MVLFLSELNDLETRATDVENACLESRCVELAFVVTAMGHVFRKV